jgi:Flp pilus assembly pilin Flp
MEITPGIAAILRWPSLARRHDDDQRGQATVDYALILVLIAIVVIVVLQNRGSADQ